jgi:hypothetical protein
MRYLGVLGAATFAIALSGCSSSGGGGNGNHGGNGGTGGGGGADMSIGGGGAGGSGGSGGGGGGASGCVGLQCQQVTCTNGGSTTLTGKVFAPDGKTPLYNAIVYVPNSTPPAFTDGVTCDRCNAQVLDPVVSAITDATGSFTLTNVPVGDKIPLVVQMGKWRKQTTVSVPMCATTPVAAANTSLPKNSSEGDIPHIAIATGSADPFECLLLKVGIDPNEITIPNAPKPGRISFWEGETSPGTTMSGAVSASDATNGLLNMQTIMKYDVVILPCEGTNDYSGTSSADQQLLSQYLTAGGRVFSTHYSYQWLTYTGSPYNAIGTWNPQTGGADTAHFPCGFTGTGKNATPISTCGYDGTIDTSFPKGMAFGQWMTANASVMNDAFEIVDPRNDLNSVDTTVASRWVYHSGDNKVLHTTFNTPLNPTKDDMGEPNYCGRVVFSDFHVSGSEVSDSNGTFPTTCKSGELTTQEKALVFMLFDLSSCIQSDTQPPVPPIT